MQSQDPRSFVGFVNDLHMCVWEIRLQRRRKSFNELLPRHQTLAIETHLCEKQTSNGLLGGRVDGITQRLEQNSSDSKTKIRVLQFAPVICVPVIEPKEKLLPSSATHKLWNLCNRSSPQNLAKMLTQVRQHLVDHFSFRDISLAVNVEAITDESLHVVFLHWEDRSQSCGDLCCTEPPISVPVQETHEVVKLDHWWHELEPIDSAAGYRTSSESERAVLNAALVIQGGLHSPAALHECTNLVWFTSQFLQRNGTH
mmetsp:Transcript_47876/g.126746  ORF Transcript_47876/g.126746 Transcript_47876/m.126746 type:complete len:256 (+) Transcript_47876:244-1011(+)